MSNAIGLVLGGAGILGLVLGVVALFRPLPDLKMPTRARAVLVILASLVLMGVGGSLLPPPTTEKPTASQTASAPPASTEPATFRIGDAIDQDGYRLTITKVLERDQVGSTYLPEPASNGGVLIVVEYTLENRSDAPMSAFSFPTPVLIDPNGVVYRTDAGKSGAYAMEGKFNRKVISDLNPGIEVKDAQVFEVSRATFSHQTWQLGIGGKSGPRISLQPASGNAAATKSAKGAENCSNWDVKSERVMCENPDLLKQNDAMAKRLLPVIDGPQGTPRRTQFYAEYKRFMECDTRACVKAFNDRWERLATEWGY